MDKQPPESNDQEVKMKTSTTPTTKTPTATAVAYETTITVQEPVERDGRLEVEGVKYALLFDWNAGAAFEVASGKALSEAMDELADSRLSAITFRALIYAGLRDKHKNVTLEHAGTLVGRIGYKHALRIAEGAFRYFFPESFEAESTKDRGDDE